MGRIKKAAGAKHEVTLSPGLRDFIKSGTELPLRRLIPHLKSLDWEWPYPRGDLYHWIPLLNHFDNILEEFVKEYRLESPQTTPFTDAILRRGLPETPSSLAADADKPSSSPDHSEEDDRELIVTIVNFTRILHENCGNRSLYSSSERLGHLLNSTDVSLVTQVLLLTHRLAIRYQHACQSGQNGSGYTSTSLKQSHYNINLDQLQQLADSVNGSKRTKSSNAKSLLPDYRRFQRDKTLSEAETPSLFSASTMISFTSTSDEVQNTAELLFTWPDQTTSSEENQSLGQVEDPEKDSPSKAASTRATNKPFKPSRLSTVHGTNAGPPPDSEKRERDVNRSIRIDSSELRSKPTYQIIADHIQDIPEGSRSAFLTQIREAKVFLAAPSEWHTIVALRILALTNLAYATPESFFQQKMLQHDSDQPRQLQIVQQLADMVQPPSGDELQFPVLTCAIALECLDAFSKLKCRITDVCSALNTNVSHGVLWYLLRRTITELEGERTAAPDNVYFHSALVALVETLCGSGGRTPDSLVAAGLLEILVDSLKLRSPIAERGHARIIGILNLIISTARDGFQSFVDCKGLDVIAELISGEVVSSIERVDNGNAFPQSFKSQVTDFSIPYFQQQTLKGLLKFVNHMMSHNNANFERLLRNLIDSPPLLKGLREIVGHSHVFGSSVWSGAVNVLSNFIHNEPTSYAVIAEAGLSKTLIEAILDRPVHDSENTAAGENTNSVMFVRGERDTIVKRVASGVSGTESDWTNSEVNMSRLKYDSIASGILPATEAINAIPTAFGAICLHNSGLELLLSSGVIEKFFEIFESHDHVNCLTVDVNLPKNLGASFDELIRHHPGLKNAVIEAIILMVARIERLCLDREITNSIGARLRKTAEPVRQQDIQSDDSAVDRLGTDGDVTMTNAPTNSESSASRKASDAAVISYIGILAKFLSGFFENQTWCGSFITAGGLEFLLGTIVSPALPYDLSNKVEIHELFHVFHLLIEYKPHLVLPTVITKLTSVLEELEPLMQHNRPAAFFSTFTAHLASDSLSSGQDLSETGGTNILKALIKVHALVNVLHEAFIRSPFSSRSSHTLFSQTNLTDYYIPLIEHLGRLYRVCVWEVILTKKAIGEKAWHDTRVDGYGLGSDEADEVLGFRQAVDLSEEELSGTVPQASTEKQAQPEGHSDSSGIAKTELQSETHRANIKALRFVLSQIPSCITPFLQSLGRNLVPRRRIDPYQRQNAFMTANAIAEVAVSHLSYPAAIESGNTQDQTSFLIVAITSVTHLFIDGADGTSTVQCLTLLLYAFQSLGGLKRTNELLESFAKPLETPDTDEPHITKSRLNGLKLLLAFYSQIASGKLITESQQSQTLASAERDQTSPYYFNSNQLLVEIRYAVIRSVETFWSSTLVDNAPTPVVKSLIDILRICWETQQEHSVSPDGDRRTRRALTYNSFTISQEKLTALKGKGIPEELAKEALFRCNSSRESAEEYCSAHQHGLNIPRLPIPSYELSKDNSTTTSSQPARPRAGSEETIPDGDSASQAETQEDASQHSESNASAAPARDETQQTAPVEADVSDGMAMSIDNLLNIRETPGATEREGSGSSDETSAMPHKTPVWDFGQFAANQNLEQLRKDIRTQLVGRVLDVLNSHGDLTFELADLLITAASSLSDAAVFRSEVGPLLVSSLASMAGEDPKIEGKKIASLANLLAIVIQEKELFEATVADLKDQFSQLLGFITVVSDGNGDSASPWAGQTMLVLEKLLAEDVQPEQIKWTPPTSGTPDPETPIAELEKPLVRFDEKEALFKCIMDIIPAINKDQTLALSAVRILVILSRDREIATRMAEKYNIQKLFLMMKQLAGNISEKLQNTFLLVLRHIIEDEECIRRVMETEIRQCFQTHRGRPIDTTVYVRNMHAYVLRSPTIFLDVTNQMLKLERYEPSQRPQSLVLKSWAAPDLKTANSKGGNASGDLVSDTVTAEASSSDQAQSATEGSPDAKVSLASVESKLPVIEHPDGVVHYIISQLLTYKEVDEKEPESDIVADNATSSNEMELDTEAASSAAVVSTQPGGSAGDSETKVESHPIHFYRIFLLQCLTEILGAYSKSKVEFINYSRKSEGKSTTPSKPRSAVLSYIFNTLVPLTTAGKANNAPSTKKALLTCNWAMAVIVSLCIKTNETPSVPKRDMAEEPADSTLSFVRRFVLEQSLKALKDAQSIVEPASIKHPKLASFADLFLRILTGRNLPNYGSYSAESQGNTIKEISKIMFEKGYIGALTCCVSDIDLNLESSKRLVKYVLRPLKILTQSTIQLSEISELLSPPGTADEDEISTATSVTDEENGREETPDLYRNSVLSMAAGPDDEEDSDSGSEDEDEEMYDDDYDEAMDYEEEVNHDHGEVISDEEEDIAGSGDVEGLPGDGAMHVTVVNLTDDDDDLHDDDDDGDGSENDMSDEDDDLDEDDMDTEQELDDIVEEITADDDNDSLSEGDDYGDDDIDDTSEPSYPAFAPVSIDLVANDRHEGNGHHLDIEVDVDPEDDIHGGPTNLMDRDGRPDGPNYELDFAVDREEDEDDLEDDEEPEDGGDEDVMYPTWEDGDGEIDDDQPPWGWDDDGPIVRRNIRPMGHALGHHHHHHHHGESNRRGIISPWEIFPSRYTSDGMGPYRGQRGGPGMRASDDNGNPLLRRPVRRDQPSRGVLGQGTGTEQFISEFLNVVPGAGPGVSLLNSLMQPGSIIGTIPAGVEGSRHAIHLQLTRQGGLMAFPPSFPRIGGRTAEQLSRGREDPFFQPAFHPATTPFRWAEEARLLYGASAPEKTQRIVNSLLKMLVPPAIEEDRIQKEKDAEAARKRREEEERVRAEQLAKEQAEREEQERKEREEREAREAAERDAAAQRAREAVENQTEPAAMEGVETTSFQAEPSTSGEGHDGTDPSSTGVPQQRTLIRLGDREVDITHLGIDQDYLDALPEELREEVLMQAFADQRLQQASAGQEPTDIDREFLDALPPGMREELLVQEAQDRRRREREELRRRATETGGPANVRAEDMDAADFFATLEPTLRSAVLQEQDDDILAQLPPPLAAEARSLIAGRMGAHRLGDAGRPTHHEHPRQPHAEAAPITDNKKPARRRIVQMLDKAGVAALLRMLFVTPQHFSREVLNTVLDNAAQNRQNRTEILSILLSILQEGTVDFASLEKSFLQLSARAKQQNPQKTPQPIKRTLSGQMAVSPVNDMTPLTVTQHCLAALCQLTENPHAPTFFLTEHDSPTNAKTKVSKKGKGKDSQESKYPLNALLSLLGRKLVMDSAPCMEQLSSLLQGVTQPLQVLRHQRDDPVAKDNEKHRTTVPADASAEDQAGAGQIAPTGGNEATTVNEASGPSETQATDSTKKQRRYTPPFVPEENLRLVVNILSARECGGKTFRDTLSTINNLSVIPGAKEVFGKELVQQAQSLAITITEDLTSLTQQMNSTTSGREVHRIALAKFSPLSDQVKLLRVLTALNYIFDPKRIQSKPSDGAQDTKVDHAKADILADLYDSWAFTPLWSQLSECLRHLRRTNVPNATLILLPLIEALMVVCKNTQLNSELPLNARQEFQIASPAPEGSVHGLFFRFTEEHRKVLNDLVRQNPRLMSGTFSVLVNNPKVLEFDNKRNYFTRRLHARSDTRRPQPPLQVNVRREVTLIDSYLTLYFKSAEEIKYGKLHVRFQGEEGVDAGGVTREWFQTLSRQMFNPDYALFTPVASDRTTFHPNKDSYYNEHHLRHFHFIGRMIGKALYEGRALDCHFSRAVYKRILGKSVSLKDMETLDLEYYRSLVWMLENDITDVITETFSVETDVFGAREVKDLVENGREIPVTEENKQEYVRRVVEHRLVGSVEEQLKHFLSGFHDIVPAELIQIFNEQELELLISGLPDIDVDDWKANTEYHNYSASSAQIQWFWRAVRSFDKEERAKLLQFVTGTAKVPLNGFKELEGMNGIARFNIHRDYGNKQRLPSSHTCFNQLDLPEYEDYEALRQQLYTAMTVGGQYFGFA